MSPRLEIRLTVSPRGCLRGFEAEGHAGREPAGANIACAAATSLLRTAGRLCADRGLVSVGSADAPGAMKMALAGERQGDVDWLRGVTDFLLRGLNDLAREFPREILVRMETTEV
ncbi:MAG TPA: ribosomal-processing cysteine protease Prp [Spirochaetia bacterium]|nr:ribosomal-processing cysteine protease Prp [Spirochaetia bacterium]